jgi:hypothetical protein
MLKNQNVYEKIFARLLSFLFARTYKSLRVAVRADS